MHRKSDEMKKIISLLLVAMMSVSLCACGGSETSNNENASNENTSNKNEQTEEKSILTEYNGEPAIERECFGELLEVVELTTENWREHFKFVTYEEDCVAYDAFGELIKDENDILGELDA